MCRTDEAYAYQTFFLLYASENFPIFLFCIIQHVVHFSLRTLLRICCDTKIRPLLQLCNCVVNKPLNKHNVNCTYSYISWFAHEPLCAERGERSEWNGIGVRTKVNGNSFALLLFAKSLKCCCCAVVSVAMSKF